MQNKPLLLIAGASLLVASAVTLASSNTPSPSTGKLLAQAPSRAMMAKAPQQKGEACLGDDDQPTTLMAYMQSQGGGDYPSPMGEPSYQEPSTQEPTQYSEPLSDQGKYQGSPSAKRNTMSEKKPYPSNTFNSKQKSGTSRNADWQSPEPSDNDWKMPEPRDGERREGEQGMQPKGGGQGFFCGSLGKQVSTPEEIQACNAKDEEMRKNGKGPSGPGGEGMPKGDFQGEFKGDFKGDPNAFKGGEGAPRGDFKGDPNMINKGGEGAPNGGAAGTPPPGGTMGTPPPGGTMGTPPPGGTMGTPPPGGVSAQATKGGGFFDVKKSLPKCSELLAQRMGGQGGGFENRGGRSRGVDMGGEPQGFEGGDENQGEPYNPMNDPAQIKQQLSRDKNMFNRPEFRRVPGIKKPTFADKVAFAVSRLPGMCKLSETPKELGELLENSKDMGEFYGNLNKLDDESLLKLDGYMQTYKQWEPVCNMLGMNEGILKQSDATIAKAEVAAKKKSRYQVKADVLETFKAVVADIRKEMDTTRANLLTMSSSEQGAEEGMPFGMPPMMEELKRLNDALDGISENYGLADPDEECGDVFHDMMVLNNAVLKALSSPRAKMKMPPIPKIQCDQWDQGGPEGMGGQGGGPGGMGGPGRF